MEAVTQPGVPDAPAKTNERSFIWRWIMGCGISWLAGVSLGYLACRLAYNDARLQDNFLFVCILSVSSIWIVFAFVQQLILKRFCPWASRWAWYTLGGLILSGACTVLWLNLAMGLILFGGSPLAGMNNMPIAFDYQTVLAEAGMALVVCVLLPGAMIGGVQDRILAQNAPWVRGWWLISIPGLAACILLGPLGGFVYGWFTHYKLRAAIFPPEGAA
jgi:hypothetical protein